MKTHYDVLGVPFGADYETIRAAYRKALKVYHPDLHEGDAAAARLSKEIIDAHAVLKDPDQRALYDEYVLHHRQQRRRLFLITAMLCAGLACGGSLFLLDRSLRSEATPPRPSDRFVSAERSVPPPAGKSERLGKTTSQSTTAALPPSGMSDASVYVRGAPTPPRDIAEVESAPARAALPLSETEISSPASVVPTPQRKTAEFESAPPQIALAHSKMELPASAIVTPPASIAVMESPSPAAQSSSESAGDAAADVTVVPTPPKTIAEPPHEIAAVAPAEKSTPAGEQQETDWAEVDKRGNAEDVWKFIREHPGTPEAALAERKLAELIETSEDVASLEALQAAATEPIASKVRLRLDRLASSREIIAGALPEETGDAPQSEIQPLTALVPAPEIGAPPEETIDQAAGITPRDPKKHIKKGLALLKAGDHERAIASFTNAVLLDPPNAGYLLHRAEAWEAKGEPDQALADYDAAVRLDQTNVAALRARGLLWHRRGDSERALADLDRAIRLSFSDAKIYHDRGMIWYDMGRYNRAIADFSHAITLDPNLASAYVSRGQAFQKKGDPVTAAINFEKAVSRDPAIGKVYRDLLHGRPEKGERKAPQASRESGAP
jgi:tetratricopeptide (TPR) repeat protein/curved DNA-binding protein CbpA